MEEENFLSMKTAVVIKGNPKFIEGNKDARAFYLDLKTFLEGLGYAVVFDRGEPYTTPPPADLWVGHSRGSDRLRFAPTATKTLALGVEGGINHSQDKALSPGEVPGIFHYLLTEDMKNEIKLQLREKKQLTLCFIRQGDHVLLGMKKRGFGEGRWNGFGGKVAPGETIEEAARREMREEAGVEVGALEKTGVLEFEFQGDPDVLEVHVFRAVDFSGEPTESEEMRPQWFRIDEIPFDSMWPDDRYWLPLFLEGKKFKGRFLFGPSDIVLEYSLSADEDF
jgi:8-oxo-dGTP diphosphatase/2-hydroxy-dATP diphosphatase